MTQHVLEPNEVSYNSAITAVEKGKWEHALLLLWDAEHQEEKPPSEASAQAVWRMARRHRLAATVSELSLPNLAELSLQELSTLAWSLASSLRNLEFWKLPTEVLGEIDLRLRNGEEKLLPLRALANLAWAVAVQGNEGAPGFRSQEFFHSLQRELAQRSADLQADSFLMASATASNALEILWASNLAKFQLPTVQLSPIWHSLMHCAGMGGHAGHARPKAEQKTQVTQVTPMAARAPIGTQISKEPRVILQLPDRILVFKPSGWQVDESGEASALPLSRYISSLNFKHPILADESHQRGFLHRLDVPSSGLILVASSYEAYYDLQFQLSLGMITRDYTSLCHGWFSGNRAVRASVTWSDTGFQQDTPSQVKPGSNAESHIKLLAHLLHKGTQAKNAALNLTCLDANTKGQKQLGVQSAMSLLGIRIATGRKHQIRVHLAYVGHPTVSDAIYSSSSTYQEDLSWCQRNFLHRYYLAFRRSGLQQNALCEAAEPLPSDLQDAMTSLTLRKVQKGAAPLAQDIFRPFPAWDRIRSISDERKKRLPFLQKDFVSTLLNPEPLTFTRFADISGRIVDKGKHKTNWEREGLDPREVTKTLKAISQDSAQKALAHLNSLVALAVQANSFHNNTILSSFRTWQWREALELLQEFECSSCADAVSYNCVMNLLKWQTALKLFGKALNSLRDTHGATNPRDMTLSYNSFTSSLSKAPDAWKKSQHLLLTMRMNHVRLDHFSYMAGLQKSLSWQKSRGILTSMLSTSVLPDLLTWNSMALPNWESSLHLLQFMHCAAFLPDLISYHRTMTCGGWQRALSLMKLAELKVKVNSISFNSALGSFGMGARAWPTAKILLESMSLHGLVPDVVSLNTFASNALSDLSALSGFDSSSLYSWRFGLVQIHKARKLGMKTDLYSVTAAIQLTGMANPGSLGIAWQRGLHVLQKAEEEGHQRETLVISSNMVVNQCSRIHEWQTALQFMGFDEFGFSTMTSACEKAFQWQHALGLLNAMPVRRLRRDLVCFGSGASACDKGKQWQLALCLLSAMPDCRLKPNLITFNAVISACGNASKLGPALSLFELLGTSVDVISYNAALSACEKASSWQKAIHLFEQMAIAYVKPDPISFNALVTACENKKRWEQVLFLLADDSTPCGAHLFRLCEGDCSKEELSELLNVELAQIAWRLAKMGQIGMFDISPLDLAHAWRRVAATLINSSISELGTCLWSMAVLNVQDDNYLMQAVEQLRKRIAAGQHKRLPTSSLGNLLWALGSLARRGVSRDANATHGEERSEPDNLRHHRLEMNDVYYTLQKEILGRVESPSTGILLQVLWASAFSKQLPKSILDGFAKLILRCANHLDRLANRFEVCKTESVESPSVLSNDTIAPHPVQVWQDRQVILKPPGWQVDDSAAESDSKRMLSHYLESVLPSSQQNLLGDLTHRRGFLHRLDVPTSGLILVATSYRAYYDLQIQLVTGAMRRDYIVLSHGSSSRKRLDANVHWLEDGPEWFSGSRVLQSGKPALSLLKTVASYASSEALRSLTLIRIQILTGRCHQIRLHTAHAGHPVVTDGRYSSSATYEEDRLWCKRNFLHRYRLDFYCTNSTSKTKVVEQLPLDLKSVLTRLILTRGWPVKNGDKDLISSIAIELTP